MASKKTFTDILLKPLWQVLASPGLGNPHTPHEAALMLAGVKPVAIVLTKDAARMQPGIQSGQIVHIADEIFDRTHHLYFNHQAADSANLAVSIITQSWKEHEAFPQDLDFIPGLFSYTHQTGRAVEKHKMSIGKRMDTLNEDIHFGRQNQDLNDFLEGKILALPPIHCHPQMDLPASLTERHARGEISLLKYNVPLTIQVYAQADKADEGRELHARYYSTENEYPPLSGEAQAARIGKLLGFTDNDIAWHLGTKYQGPISSRFMEETKEIRQYARLKMMLWDSSMGPRDLTL